VLHRLPVPSRTVALRRLCVLLVTAARRRRRALSGTAARRLLHAPLERLPSVSCAFRQEQRHSIGRCVLSVGNSCTPWAARSVGDGGPPQAARSVGDGGAQSVAGLRLEWLCSVRNALRLGRLLCSACGMFHLERRCSVNGVFAVPLVTALLRRRCIPSGAGERSWLLLIGAALRGHQGRLCCFGSGFLWELRHSVRAMATLRWLRFLGDGCPVGGALRS
jgi:hypothetical protein